MNVIFLDYDGVVNTPIWNNDGTKCQFGMPKDNKVNNFQAVQWVSEFCQKYDYSIVISSSWRTCPNYKECLINGGLRQGIDILGRTEAINSVWERGIEIQHYLDEHPEITNFLIFDDENDMGDLIDHLVRCDANIGFVINEYEKACILHQVLGK